MTAIPQPGADARNRFVADSPFQAALATENFHETGLGHRCVVGGSGVDQQHAFALGGRGGGQQPNDAMSHGPVLSAGRDEEAAARRARVRTEEPSQRVTDDALGPRLISLAWLRKLPPTEPALAAGAAPRRQHADHRRARKEFGLALRQHRRVHVFRHQGGAGADPEAGAESPREKEREGGPTALPGRQSARDDPGVGAVDVGLFPCFLSTNQVGGVDRPQRVGIPLQLAQAHVCGIVGLGLPLRETRAWSTGRARWRRRGRSRLFAALAIWSSSASIDRRTLRSCIVVVATSGWRGPSCDAWRPRAGRARSPVRGVWR